MKYLIIITIALLSFSLMSNSFAQMPDSVQPNVNVTDHSKYYLSGPSVISKNVTNNSSVTQLKNNTTQISNNPIVSNITHQIPNWVKAVFGYYAQGKLSDNDLIQALQFLIQQGIIKI